MRRMVGVNKAVNSPFNVRPRLAKAPYLRPRSMAVDVPTAWLAVPMDNPWAMGLSTCPQLRTLNPSTAPNRPTHTTTAAVSEGIPPTLLVTSIAMGVVTDLAASEVMIVGLAPSHLAVMTTETIPTRQPVSWEIRMGSSCFFISRNWRYKGTPKATTAGFSQNSIKCPPRL